MSTIKYRINFTGFKILKGVRNLKKRTAQLRLNRSKGFTLVELLVVIAIIAILAAVVVLIINPLELTRRSRDATRLADLSGLEQAINVAVQEATNSGAAILCTSTGAYPCNGSSHTGTRIPNGTGWVAVDLSANQSVSVGTLPIDPVNNATYHYTYCADNDTFEIDTVMESVQYQSKMSTDGGDESDKYERGSTLTLISASGGTCTY